MKNIKIALTTLILLFAICSCDGNRKVVDGSSCIGVYQNDVYYYAFDGNWTIKKHSDKSNSDIKISDVELCHTPMCIIDDKLYYASKKEVDRHFTLYSIDCAKKNSVPVKVSEIVDDISGADFLGNGGVEFEVFEYNNKIYVFVNRNLYQLGKDTYEKVGSDIFSICIDDNKIYYSKSNGDICLYHNGIEDVVFTKDILKEDRYINETLGGEAIPVNITKNGDELYFIETSFWGDKGAIYKFDLKNKSCIMLAENPELIYNYEVYEDIVYYILKGELKYIQNRNIHNTKLKNIAYFNIHNDNIYSGQMQGNKDIERISLSEKHISDIGETIR